MSLTDLRAVALLTSITLSQAALAEPPTAYLFSGLHWRMSVSEAIEQMEQSGLSVDRLQFTSMMHCIANKPCFLHFHGEVNGNIGFDTGGLVTVSINGDGGKMYSKRLSALIAKYGEPMQTINDESSVKNIWEPLSGQTLSMDGDAIEYRAASAPPKPPVAPAVKY